MVIRFKYSLIFKIVIFDWFSRFLEELKDTLLQRFEDMILGKSQNIEIIILIKSSQIFYRLVKTLFPTVLFSYVISSNRKSHV